MSKENWKDKDVVSEAFMAKLTITRMVVGGSLKKEAMLEVADRYGNRFEYNISDSRSIQKMLEEYDTPDDKHKIDKLVAQAYRDGWNSGYQHAMDDQGLE